MVGDAFYADELVAAFAQLFLSVVQLWLLAAEFQYWMKVRVAYGETAPPEIYTVLVRYIPPELRCEVCAWSQSLWLRLCLVAYTSVSVSGGGRRCVSVWVGVTFLVVVFVSASFSAAVARSLVFCALGACVCAHLALSL